MHIAGAVGCSVVVLSEPTDDARSGPFGADHLVLRSDLGLVCIPCHPGRNPGVCDKEGCETLHANTVEEVVAASAQQLTKEEGGWTQRRSSRRFERTTSTP